MNVTIDKLAPTVTELQASGLHLLDRMINPANSDGQLVAVGGEE